MYYFALLLGTERAEQTSPDAVAGIMAAYTAFHTVAASAIRAGDALQSTDTGARITGGPHAPVVTDGPFPEGAEVAGGYYVFEADNLDDALELARQIPACETGAVEVWPMVGWTAPQGPVGQDWLALLLEAPEDAHPPTSEQFESGLCAHAEFGKAAGDHIISGAPLREPSTATTVKVRDGQAIFTDGPFVEGAEVANGFYILRAQDRDEAVKLASMIPASTIELRQLSGVSGL